MNHKEITFYDAEFCIVFLSWIIPTLAGGLLLGVQLLQLLLVVAPLLLVELMLLLLLLQVGGLLTRGGRAVGRALQWTNALNVGVVKHQRPLRILKQHIKLGTDPEVLYVLLKLIYDWGLKWFLLMKTNRRNGAPYWRFESGQSHWNRLLFVMVSFDPFFYIFKIQKFVSIVSLARTDKESLFSSRGA
jgi:hypothetical protein